MACLREAVVGGLGIRIPHMARNGVGTRQLETLVLQVRELVIQYEATRHTLARQTPRRSEQDRQDTYDRQIAGSRQTWEPQFDHLLALAQSGDAATLLDKLNEAIGSLEDASE
jgi:hypothetical protein